MDVLVLGVKEEINQAVKKMLEEKGVETQTSTDLDNAPSQFNANTFKVLCLGGGLSTELRATLKEAFKKQNPNVGIVETFAPVAIAQVLRVLQEQQGNYPLAKDFQVNESGEQYRLTWELNAPYPVRVDLYQIQNEQPVSIPLLEEVTVEGKFDCVFDKALILPNLNLAVVSINNEPYFFHSIN